MRATYDPVTREYLVTVRVRDIRYLGSTAYGTGVDADGQLVSFIMIDRASAEDIAARLDRGEDVETAIPGWAIFDGGATTRDR